MSNFIVSGISYYQAFQQPQNMGVTAYTFACSGTSILESEEERVVRVRKEKRDLRNKKLERIYGREPKEEGSRQVECDIGQT